MMKAEIVFNRSSHICRLMTGFHLLEKQGILSCRYIEKENQLIPGSHKAVVEVRIDHRRIVFDLGDRSALHHAAGKAYLSDVDMYFERSHEDWSRRTEYAEQADKIKPFGFDYYASYPHNPADKKPGSFSQRIKAGLKAITGVSRCTGVDAIEGRADYKENNIRILFMTRLWDPAEIVFDPDENAEVREYQEYLVYERNKINKERIEICRSLQSAYPYSFVGGIQYGKYASELCPDLILPDSLTRKHIYLKTMKNADICIGSAGLHKSIGWKTGEYVAAARAIVCEEPAYLLPGDFCKGINYCSYHDVDSCLREVNELFDHPERIYRMKCANEAYYHNYLRPEKQIMNALRQCGIPDC